MVKNAVWDAFPFLENETLGNGNADILTFNIYSFLFLKKNSQWNKIVYITGCDKIKISSNQYDKTTKKRFHNPKERKHKIVFITIILIYRICAFSFKKQKKNFVKQHIVSIY
jgi:hypothetical protein